MKSKYFDERDLFHRDKGSYDQHYVYIKCGSCHEPTSGSCHEPINYFYLNKCCVCGLLFCSECTRMFKGSDNKHCNDCYYEVLSSDFI